MKPMLTAIILLSVSAPLVRAQDFGDTSDLKAAMGAYKSQMHAPQLSAASVTKPEKEYYHRMGHGQATNLTPSKSVQSVIPTVASTSTPVNQTQTPDISAYPVHGADISHYNGTIAWNQVTAQGLSFVFIKATESDDYADPMLMASWDGAAGIGLARGAYHFYDFCKPGAAQAANFIKTVPAVSGALPLVIDLEMSSDCTQAQMPAKDAFLKDLSDFTSQIQAAYGKTPILYTNLSMYKQYMAGSTDAYKIWIADPHDASPNIGSNWAFWQYSWTGKVSGMPSDVDLDVFNGNASGLAALTK